MGGEREHQPYLRVRNWEKYQDANLAAKYRESGGVLPWVKQMARRLEEDYEYAALHPLARYIWTECIGLAAVWGPNRLPWNIEWLQSKMHASYLGEQFAVHLNELVAKGWLIPSGETEPARPLSSTGSTEPGTDSGTEPGTSKSKELRGISSNEEILTSEKIGEVYEHWRAACEKSHGRYATITPARRKVIATRLKEFPVAELKRALDGVAADPWEDRPRHNDLTTVFRSPERVQKFLEIAENPALQAKKRGVSASDILRGAV